MNELGVIHSIATACVEEKDEDRLIERATEIIGEAVYPTNFGIMLLDEESQKLITHPSYRLWENQEAIVLSLEEGITGKAALMGKPFRVGDVSLEDNYIRGDSRTRSELCVPIKIGERVIGVINTEHDQPSFFTEDDERLLVTFAGQIAPAIERMRTEERLRTEKERLSVTLLSIGEGVITISTEGKIILLNRVAEEMTGWRQEKASGESLENVFNVRKIQKDENGKCSLFETVRQAESLDWRSDILLIRKNDQHRNVELSSAPIHDERKRIIGYVLVFRDITEQLKLENEAQKVQKLEAIGLLAGGIAHDFNNILAVMLANVDMAKLSLEQEYPVEDRLDNIENAIERAAKLTKQLLTFSKGGTPVKETGCMRSLIEESVSFILSGSKVECKFEIDEDLQMAEIDVGQINQALNNVLLNAAQAMDESGTIAVKAKNIDLKEGEISSLPEGKYIEVNVIDEGTGISQENLSRVFDPYFSTKPGGSGLGITTAYAVVKKHGGWMDIISRVGKGTTVKILLPATIKKLKKDRKEPTYKIVKGSGKILFMDDEKNITHAVEGFLKGIGYSVTIASNGKEAITHYKKVLETDEPYDLVILDLTIPGKMGGKEVLKNLLESDPNVRAIATSGYSNDPVMAEYKEYGFHGILPKPFRMSELSRIVKSVISK